MDDFFGHTVVKGAISGFLAAALVDYRIFASFKTFDQFTNYDWRIAAVRWMQGAIMGAVAAAGFNVF